MTTLSPEIAAVAEWLQKESQQYDFADLNVSIRIHSGKIFYIERSAMEKLKPAEILGGKQHDNRSSNHQ